MLRTCLSSCSRAVASTSQTNAFHTSAPTLSQATKRIGVRNKKKNLQKTAQRLQEAAANRPSVVLGTRTAEEEEKWKNCLLSKILVNEAELASTTELTKQNFPVGDLELPKQFGHGVAQTEKELLFRDLPMASAQIGTEVGKEEAKMGDGVLEEDELREQRKANLLAKALDLRNANAGGIAFENRRRIIHAFSTPENPFDPGRTEVQVALLTYKIRNLWKHLPQFKADVANRRSLRKLIHQRGALLRYLRNNNRDRYETVLEQLALEPEAVEGELVV
ncbi:unnamed protein product [Cyclocybe aegerita]|uniref:Ribosomal protein S15 n=1 Tax=Cyclocybe aegerita TaxID=1973307 RepID=A0A8S0WQQ7_CYCAE|nr:unnamed protein product [Cyclocybe aegerita]